MNADVAALVAQVHEAYQSAYTDLDGADQEEFLRLAADAADSGSHLILHELALHPIGRGNYASHLSHEQ